MSSYEIVTNLLTQKKHVRRSVTYDDDTRPKMKKENNGGNFLPKPVLIAHSKLIFIAITLYLVCTL